MIPPPRSSKDFKRFEFVVSRDPEGPLDIVLFATVTLVLVLAALALVLAPILALIQVLK